MADSWYNNESRNGSFSGARPGPLTRPVVPGGGLMPHSTPSPKRRLSRRERDVQDCVDAYLRLSEESGWRSVGSTSVAVEVGKRWGRSFTDDRYEAAEEGMYNSPELQALFESWRNPTPKNPLARLP